MKIKKLQHPGVGALYLAAFSALPLSAQPAVANKEVEKLSIVDPGPKDTDRASRQLVKNYLTVTSAESQHLRVQNAVAEGTNKASTLLRNFKLTETSDGKRPLTQIGSTTGLYE